MKSNNRLFKIIVGTVLLLIMIGYFLVLHFRMDEPIFLQHYYEEFIDREGNTIHSHTLPLSYITNRNDERVVVGMEFLEYPDILVFASEHQDHMNTPGDAIGPYSIRHVNWKIGDVPEEVDLNETIVSEVTFLFDDGSDLTTHIGEIHLNTLITEDTFLEFSSGFASSDGVSRTRYLVSEDVKVSSLESPLLNKFSDRIQIEIGSETSSDAVGTTFQEGDDVTVSSEIISLEDDFNLLNIQPILTLTNENNERHQHRILNINHINPHYTFNNIYRYIEEKEVE